MISNAKNNVSAWRLPRAGTCGVPEADAFFAAFDDMCEVLEKFAGEIPAGYRAQIEIACADFVAMKETMGITPFCILDFKCHIDWIIEHRLDDITEEEKDELYSKGLLSHRRLFEQMASVYADNEVVDEIIRFQESEALRVLGEAESRSETAPGMLPAIGSDDAEGWQRASERLWAHVIDAFSRISMPPQLAAAAAHLKETTLGTIFSTFGVYTRKRLADVLSKRDGIPATEAETCIRRWEEAGQIRRVNYWGILNAWNGSEFYEHMEERENMAVYTAICQIWRNAVRAGLIGNNQTQQNDGLEI